MKNREEHKRKSKDIIITGELGLHLRPAGLLVKTASNYTSDITIEKEGMAVDGKSIIGITSLHAVKNSTITISASGPDAEEAVAALEELITNNFRIT